MLLHHPAQPPSTSADNGQLRMAAATNAYRL